MQININGQELQQSADDAQRSEPLRMPAPDKRCELSHDELWRRLDACRDASGEIADVDLWRQSFILAPNGGDTDPWCKQCCRRLSQHHADGSRPWQPADAFAVRCPLSCSQVQSRLNRNVQHAQAGAQQGGMFGQLQSLGMMAFTSNPTTGELLCRGCLYPICKHGNGQDAADAMLNAMGMGGLMNMAHGMGKAFGGIAGPQMLGGADAGPVQLPPHLQLYQQRREAIAAVLGPDRGTSNLCPYLHFDFREFEEASAAAASAGQNKTAVWSLFFENKSSESTSGNIKTTTRWVACRNCGDDVARHGAEKVQLTPEQTAQLLSAVPGGAALAQQQSQQQQTPMNPVPPREREIAPSNIPPIPEPGQAPPPPPPGQPMPAPQPVQMMGNQPQQQHHQHHHQQQPQPMMMGQQQQPQAASPYQQFGGGAQQQQQHQQQDDYIEVQQMEMCCGCFPRMVTKRVPRSQAGMMGMHPAMGMGMRGF